MKKKIGLLAAVMGSVVGLFVAKHFMQTKSMQDIPVVAITQIVPHPSLELIRQGILDELKAQQLAPEIVYENAQGNIATAVQIAKRFVSLKPKVIVPITTPSAVTAFSEAKGAKIPLVFVAVNDPVEAKLIAQADKPGPLVTGMSSLPPLEESLAFIQKTFPKATRIGIIFNPGESNAVVERDLLAKLTAKAGLTLVEAAASNTTMVGSAAQSLVGKVDVIYLPNDNSVISALDSILRVTKAANIPTIASDPESVDRGCTAAVAHDQYAMGRQAGSMVADVLKGKAIADIPPQAPTKIVTKVNPAPSVDAKTLGD